MPNRLWEKVPIILRMAVTSSGVGAARVLPTAVKQWKMYSHAAVTSDQTALVRS